MIKHNEREDLVGEHPFGDAGQLILFFAFLAVWAADSLFRFSTAPAGLVPLIVRLPLSIMILIGSFFLAKAGHGIVFGEVRDEPEVIDRGVFTRVRHPLYLAVLLFYLGLLLSTMSVAAAIVWGCAALFYNFIAQYEENRLLEVFGKEYTDYMGRVPRWIPRLK